MRRAQTVEGRAGHRQFLAGRRRLDDFLLRHAQREIQVHPIRNRAGAFHSVGSPLSGVNSCTFWITTSSMMSISRSRTSSRIDHFIAETVDDFALLVHHVVVLERAFAALEVVLLDALLRLLDGFVEHEMLQLLPLLQAHFLHHLDNPVRTEQPHQVVLQRNEKMRRAGIALARATSPQLPVNAPRFVPFRADDVQAAQDRPRLRPT